MDFWPAYEKATRAKLPRARIIYDRFHLSRILNRKVEEERREYQKQLPGDERRELKRDCRWLILKRRSNLNDENISHLDKLKQSNEPLYELYLLKEDFLDIFERGKEVDQARQEILAWIDMVMASSWECQVNCVNS
jgi:transposase